MSDEKIHIEGKADDDVKQDKERAWQEHGYE
jgi:hypothetical protein